MSATFTIVEAEYRVGGSDKFYRTFAAGNRWVAQYGRNGTLGTTSKIAQVADRQSAIDAAAKQMASKVKKGYEVTGHAVVEVHGVFDMDDVSFLDRLAQDNCTSDGVSAPAPVAAAAVSQTRADRTEAVVAELEMGRAATAEDICPTKPLRPMLASSPDADTVARMMQDQDVLAQVKYDGDRVVIEVVDGTVRALNRQGVAKVKNVGTAHTDPFTALGRGRWAFDGEVVGSTLVLFDMVAATDGTTCWVGAETGFEARYEVLRMVADALGLAQEGSIVIAPLYDPRLSPEVKSDLLAQTVSDGREGIILRRRNARYEQAHRSAGVVKVKNVKDADVIVTGLGEQKESAALSAYAPDGELVVVGMASTIGKGEVGLGEVWTVSFLNVNDPANPRMFQPRLVRKRTDKSAAECSTEQFAHAGANRSV